MKKEICCGCIIVEDGKVLLVQENEGHWGLPKGHMEGNETYEETAIREVKEETNLDVEIDSSKRFEISYIIEKKEVYKTVYFFHAKVKSGIAKRQEKEIKQIEWVPIEESSSKLTYKDVSQMLEKALKELGYIK